MADTTTEEIGRRVLIVGAATADSAINELAFRTLAGGRENPRQAVVEVIEAERLNLGSAFLGERLHASEAATMAGAVGAVTNRLGLAVATASHQVRHPLVLASHCLTMHKLTGGRFTLGLAPGPVSMRAESSGDIALTPPASLRMADLAVLLRRLWAGETVADHDGPAGRFSEMKLKVNRMEQIPLGVVAADVETLDVGGRVFDSVVLQPYLSDEVTRRCVAAVRNGAERAGRNPAQVRVWAALSIVGDQIADEAQRRKAVGRLAGRLQARGDRLVGDNGWNPEALAGFRNDLFVRSFRAPISTEASDSELDHIAELIPAEWLEVVAFGSSRQRAEQIARQFDHGVDGVVLQGPAPWDLRLAVDQYRSRRSILRFSSLPANPAARRITVGTAAGQSASQG